MRCCLPERDREMCDVVFKREIEICAMLSSRERERERERERVSESSITKRR